VLHISLKLELPNCLMPTEMCIYVNIGIIKPTQHMCALLLYIGTL